MSFSPLLDLDEWTIPISADERQQAQNARDRQLNPLAGDWAYHSYLGESVLRAFLDDSPEDSSLEEHSSGESSPDNLIQATPGFSAVSLVEGVALQVDQWKIVAIATDSIDTLELRVPQEWVDLPQWIGDYYVAIQILPDAERARILGYATHQQLKQDGEYDTFDRTYSLDTEVLLSSSVFCSTYRAYGREQTRVPIESIASIPSATREPLLQRLANPALLIPRLEIPFRQWGALLEDVEIRQQLDAARQSGSSAAISDNSANLTDLPEKVATQLGRWLQGQIQNNWQGLDQLMPQRAIAARSRLSDSSLDVDVSTPQPSLYRAKELSLSIQQTLALAIGVAATADNQVQVSLTLETLASEDLAEPVTLRLLDDKGAELAQASAATTESLTMRFVAAFGESFSVEVSSQGHQVIEHFSV